MRPERPHVSRSVDKMLFDCANKKILCTEKIKCSRNFYCPNFRFYSRSLRTRTRHRALLRRYPLPPGSGPSGGRRGSGRTGGRLSKGGILFRLAAVFGAHPSGACRLSDGCSGLAGSDHPSAAHRTRCLARLRTGGSTSGDRFRASARRWPGGTVSFGGLTKETSSARSRSGGTPTRGTSGATRSRGASTRGGRAQGA